MKTKYISLVSVTILSTSLLSCGKSSSNNSSGKMEERQEIAPADGSNIEGHYQANFVTLNPHVNGTIPGSANFFRKDEKIFSYVRLFAGGVKAWHMQHVYEGSRCPSINDDRNGDGFVDILEAEAVLGKILIPLDSDISSQSSGRRFFPVADLSGYYHYERITNFRRFLEDLQEVDRDPNDDLIKLAPGEGLTLTGRAVLIQGVSETVQLPETVATKGRNSAFQTLPIVCGIFKKVSSLPGTEYNEVNGIPGPIADVIDGQDQPGAEPTDNSNGNQGGSSGTGSTNESDDGEGPVSDGQSGGSSTGGSSTGGSSTGGSSTGGSSTGGSSTGGSTTGGSTTGGSTTGGSTTGDSTTGGSTTGGSTTGEVNF